MDGMDSRLDPVGRRMWALNAFATFDRSERGVGRLRSREGTWRL